MRCISKSKFNEQVFIAFLFFIPFLVCVFRPLSSTDTSGYLNYFNSASFDFRGVELSFSLISLIGKSLFGDVYGFRFVLFCYTAIGFLVLLKIIEKTDSPVVAFFVYFAFAYTYQMCIQMRSSVSNLIFILALFDIRDRKVKSYYLKMLIAFFFHESSILFFCVYPFCVLILKYRKILYILPVVFISSIYLLNSLSTSLGFLENSEIGFIHKFLVYSQLSSYADSKVNPINRISLFLFVFYYVFIFGIKIKNLNNLEIISLCVISISLFCFFFGARFFPIIAQRYPEGLNLALVVLIPSFFRHCREWKILLVFLMLYLFLVAMNYGTITTQLSYFF